MKETIRLKRLCDTLQQRAVELEANTSELQTQSQQLRECNVILEQQIVEANDKADMADLHSKQAEEEMAELVRAKTRNAEIASESEERSVKHMHEARSQLAAEQKSITEEHKRWGTQEEWYVEEIRALRAKIREIMAVGAPKGKKADAAEVDIRKLKDDDDEEAADAKAALMEFDKYEFGEAAAAAEEEEEKKEKKEEYSDEEDAPEKEENTRTLARLQQQKKGDKDIQSVDGDIGEGVAVQGEGSVATTPGFQLCKAGACLGNYAYQMCAADRFKLLHLNYWCFNVIIYKFQKKSEEEEGKKSKNAEDALMKSGSSMILDRLLNAVRRMLSDAFSEFAVNYFRSKACAIKVRGMNTIVLSLRHADMSHRGQLVRGWQSVMHRQKLASRRLAYWRTKAAQDVTIVSLWGFSP